MALRIHSWIGSWKRTHPATRAATASNGTAPIASGTATASPRSWAARARRIGTVPATARPGGQAVRITVRAPAISGVVIDNTSTDDGAPWMVLTTAPQPASRPTAIPPTSAGPTGAGSPTGTRATTAAAVPARADTPYTTGRWPTWSRPRSMGNPSVRPGWSTSWPSGSTASSAATHSARPAATTSGVVPAHTPRSAKPAAIDRPTTRTTLEAGQRSTLRTPRRTIGQRAGLVVPRIHGRDRGRSWASCRRRTSTVRRSCRVTANRS